MKKKITIAFVLLMVAVLTVTAFAFTGCKGKDDGKLKIVVTIFPEYDWVMNVLGDRASDVSVTLLVILAFLDAQCLIDFKSLKTIFLHISIFLNL